MSHTRNETTHGIKLMLLGAIILPLMDASAKMMGETIGSSTVVLARFAFQTLFLLPFVWSSIYLPSKKELMMHFKRAMALSFATLFFFTAIQVMPIADALAIFFVMPLIVTILSPWVLGESVGWRRIAAVAFGLTGAVIIIQPGHEVFGLRAFLPLGTALLFSFYLMYTRKLARKKKEGDESDLSNEDDGRHEGGEVTPLTMQFWSGLLGAIIMTIVIVLLQPMDWAIFEVAFPQAWQWKWLVIVGFFAAVGHLVMSSAFKYADASVLAPFQYIELIVAAILGWWLFKDIPTLSTVLGSGILVISGLYIFQRERVS